MNTQNVIGMARFDKGIKGWCLNNTRIGKKIVTKALESQYGCFEKVLPNGVRKFVNVTNRPKTRITTTSYIEPKKLKPTRTTIRTYDENGKRISMSSEGIDPNNKHRKSTVNMSDFPSVGRRTYMFMNKTYDTQTHRWIAETMQQKTFQLKPESDCLVTTTNKNYIDRTTAVDKITIPNLLAFIDRLFKKS